MTFFRTPNPRTAPYGYARFPSVPLRRGFWFLDVVAAIVLIGIIAVILTSTLHRTAKARDRLAAQRAATRQLEQALVDLSLSRPIDPAITVTPLSTPNYVQLSMNIAPGGSGSQSVTLIGAVTPGGAQ